ncbi:Retrovirus-related Pol polyprotein [Biomphalaria pfeifferi]|uniref:Retrovirus-related Pol polyprotein n=1 Tax=Biomphalaria pfeifferi TaxID=112525 RepID=A0AAD8FA95_BIOPF|nr:Retrovirus-related Pol polyprotein [Biomphalaria pfeifferi]
MKKSQLDKVTRKKECKLAFQALKMYTSYQVLKLPDLSRTFMLRTDASDSGLVAVLMQMAGEAGLLFLVAYASQKLNRVEKECLALQTPHRRLMRWSLLLLPYSFQIELFTWNKNLAPDFFSRHTLQETAEPKPSQQSKENALEERRENNLLYVEHGNSNDTL